MISMKCKEIWETNFNPTIGREINKTRPAIIVSDDSIGVLPLRVIVPITNWQERYDSADWHVKIEKDDINNLDKKSTADCFQLRSVSIERLEKKIGEVDEETFKKIKNALKNVFDL